MSLEAMSIVTFLPHCVSLCGQVVYSHLPLCVSLCGQVVTELERAVWGVVGRSEGVIEATDTELTAAERAELVRVMGEEGRERVRESRRWRVLMSQYEAKCQRERRIKSRR